MVYQYQQSQELPLTSNQWTQKKIPQQTDENPGPSFGQAKHMVELIWWWYPNTPSW